MDRKHLPTRSARIKARVSIGRIVKARTKKTAPKYYWMTGAHENFDSQGERANRGLRACVLRLGEDEPLTYEKMASALCNAVSTQFRTEIRKIFAVEITAEDYERLSHYDSFKLYSNDKEELAFVLPFKPVRK